MNVIVPIRNMRMNEEGKIISLFRQGKTVKDICRETGIYRNQVEDILIESGDIDSSKFKYAQ